MSKLETIWDCTSPGVGGNSIVQVFKNSIAVQCFKLYPGFSSHSLEKYINFQNSLDSFNIPVGQNTIYPPTVREIQLTFLKLPVELSPISILDVCVDDEIGNVGEMFATSGYASSPEYILGTPLSRFPSQKKIFAIIQAEISKKYPLLLPYLHILNFKVQVQEHAIMSMQNEVLEIICTDCSLDIQSLVNDIVAQKS